MPLFHILLQFLNIRHLYSQKILVQLQDSTKDFSVNN